MQQYWDNVRALYGQDRVEKYMTFSSLYSDKTLQEYTDPYDLVSYVVTSLLFDAQINGHLESQDSTWKIDLGKYQYLVELYRCPSDGPEMVTGEELVLDNIMKIQEEDLFGLFAVSIMMHLKMMEDNKS